MFCPELKWILLLVALDSTIIFIKNIGTSAIWESFILAFLLGVLIVIVTVL